MSKALPAPRCVDHRPCAYYGTFAPAVELRGRGESVEGWPQSNSVANVAIELPMLPWLNHGEDLAEHRSDLHKVGPVPRDPTEVRPSSFDFMSLSMPILTSWVYGISLSMVSMAMEGWNLKLHPLFTEVVTCHFFPRALWGSQNSCSSMPGTGIGISWNNSPTTKTKLWAAPWKLMKFHEAWNWKLNIFENTPSWNI